MPEQPEFSTDESNRIDDPDKAREMAEAGDEMRTVAASYRKTAEDWASLNLTEDEDPDGDLTRYAKDKEEDARHEADHIDQMADGVEESVGEAYEEQQGR